MCETQTSCSLDFDDDDTTIDCTPITSDNIDAAVSAWTSDAESAAGTYGLISGWDVSAVTDMGNLFNGKETFNDDISAWDVSAVTNMLGMFNGASAFEGLGDMGSWVTSKVTNMKNM